MSMERAHSVTRRALLLALASSAFACQRRPSAGDEDGAPTITLTGAGATFPYPLYSHWIASYERLNPGTRINYQSIGSGGAIRQLVLGTIDFGASDIPAPHELAPEGGRALVHLPVAVGAVAVAYNLPGVPELRLTPGLLAALFLGEITRWDDPRLAAINPKAALPSLPVRVVLRRDGSGSTAVFTEYLSKASAAFGARVGSGPSVTWPSGVGAAGNEGVTAQVKSTPGALSYIDLSNALQSGLAVALLETYGGRFVRPTLESVRAAAEAVPATGTLHVSLTHAPARDAYPIAAYTYLLTYEEYGDLDKARAVARFAWWATHDGQSACAALHYAPLPDEAVREVERRLKRLRAAGQPVVGGRVNG